MSAEAGYLISFELDVGVVLELQLNEPGKGTDDYFNAGHQFARRHTFLAHRVFTDLDPNATVHEFGKNLGIGIFRLLGAESLAGFRVHKGGDAGAVIC